MEQIEWHETYAIGLPQLDDDHRRLIDLANAIIAAHDDGDCPEYQRRGADFVAALREHFPREEKFLAEIEYPHLETHAGYHRRMIERAEAFLVLCARVRGRAQRSG
jgi:hemerythrin-like metal-binding protein